jgi:hypothetical protein
MKITITIATDNAAFEDNPAPEVARILHKLSGEIRTSSGNTADHFQRDFDGEKLRDYNGNTVGQVEITE